MILPPQQAWSPPALLLAAEADDQGLIAELIDAFSTDTAARIRRIHEALVASNLSTIRAEAHTIRGSALEVGAHAVAAACQDLETVSDLHEAALIADRLNRVQGLFEEVRRAMAAYSSNENSDVSLKPSI